MNVATLTTVEFCVELQKCTEILTDFNELRNFGEPHVSFVKLRQWLMNFEDDFWTSVVGRAANTCHPMWQNQFCQADSRIWVGGAWQNWAEVWVGKHLIGMIVMISDTSYLYAMSSLLWTSCASRKFKINPISISGNVTIAGMPMDQGALKSKAMTTILPTTWKNAWRHLRKPERMHMFSSAIKFRLRDLALRMYCHQWIAWGHPLVPRLSPNLVDLETLLLPLSVAWRSRRVIP